MPSNLTLFSHSLLTPFSFRSELSKTVATFILQKILLDETGLYYICQTYDRSSTIQLLSHTPLLHRSNAVLHAEFTPGSLTLQWSWARWWSSCPRSLLKGFSSTWCAATCASVTTLEPAKHFASVYLISWRMRPSQPAWRTTSLPSTGWRSCWRTLRRCRAKQQGSSSSSKVVSSLPSSIHLQRAWHSPRLWHRRYNLQDTYQPSIELWFIRP